jgi:hypothetical protein
LLLFFFVYNKQDLQEEYAEEAGRTGRTRLLLTITISGRKKELESRFELDELAKLIIRFFSSSNYSIHFHSYRCADWLNVQTYDYHGSRDKIAEHHSALMQAANANDDDKDLNQVLTSIVSISILSIF